jgi:Fe-S-cluster containining protein
MQLLDMIHTSLDGTTFAAALEGLNRIYERIEKAQAESRAAIAARGAALACPEDCGSCCEGFVPDILPIEARYLAAWLLRFSPELAARAIDWSDAVIGMAPPCPFYEAARPDGHCVVYPARPLICRLFGFAALRDREGIESYSLCRRMPARTGKRSWSGAELERELGAAFPDMADFSALTVALAPDEAGGRALLTQALPAELRRLSLHLDLARLESGGDPDGDEPEPSAPAPRAA